MRRGLSRREFVAASAAAGATLLLPVSSVRGANDRVNVAIIGCGDKGGAHADDFGKLADARIVAVCDPDLERMTGVAQKLGGEVAQHRDFRRVLDDKRIDAVVIATPNHWHAPLTILACAAGKHVYVEKPVSHGIWEGRQMVSAARRHGRVVQGGTQHRSDPYLQELAADLKAGKYGKVEWIHCCKLNAREPIGKVSAPTPVPASVDYELWAGPAPKTPVMRTRFHYDWHWQWDWGDGEMGNWGIHYIDDVLNVLGADVVPDRVTAAGNRFAWDDDGQTPNMHLAVFQVQGVPLVVDIRNLADPQRPEGQRPGGNGGAVYLKMRQGNCIMCEGAVIRVARGGGKAYDRKTDQEIKSYSGTGGSGHDANFIAAVRAGESSRLNAEIEVAHRSTVLCHLANIAFRAGRAASIQQVRESVGHAPDAVRTLADMTMQLYGNDVDLSKTPFVLGPTLEFDAGQEKFIGEHADRANPLLKHEYRAPFAGALPS